MRKTIHNDAFLRDSYKDMFSKSKDLITLILPNDTKDVPCFKLHNTLYVDSSALRDDVEDLRSLRLRNKHISISRANAYIGIDVLTLTFNKKGEYDGL